SVLPHPSHPEAPGRGPARRGHALGPRAGHDLIDQALRLSDTTEETSMKVVLFCGGLGMRLRDHAENVPKPLVPLGYRPIIWHIMKYYAHFGHTDFILCLGYRGDLIKNYFLNYEEALSNDFVLSDGGRRRELLNSDIEDWRITFVETGL